MRQGANGRDPSAPNAANYDESKANPYPVLPDPLVLANGKKVKTAKDWWKKRRPELVEIYDREIYGRMPAHVPGVTWSVRESKDDVVGGKPVLFRKLVGHVDNSAYPLINVDIEAELTTPQRDAKGVPVIVEFFPFEFRGRFPRAAVADLAGAGHRARLGLRRPVDQHHPGGQRRGPDQGHHRPRQQGPAAQAR